MSFILWFISLIWQLCPFLTFHFHTRVPKNVWSCDHSSAEMALIKVLTLDTFQTFIFLSLPVAFETVLSFSLVSRTQSFMTFFPPFLLSFPTLFGYSVMSLRIQALSPRLDSVVSPSVVCQVVLKSGGYLPPGQCHVFHIILPLRAFHSSK